MDKIPTSRKIIANLFYYFLDFSTILIFGYIFWILMGKLLNPVQYGILQTVASIFSILVAVTALGFNEALIKFLPELIKHGKKSEAGSMIKFSVKLVTIFSLFVSSFVFIFSDSISYLIYRSPQLVLPLKFLSLMLFTGTIFTVLKFTLQGLQQYRKLFFNDLIGNIVRIIVAVLFLYLGFQAASGILGWSFWYIAFIILSLGILRLESGGSFDKKTFYNFAFFSALSAVSLLFLFQGNILVLSLISSFEAVAYFGVAFIFGQFILFVPNIVMGTIFPNISELWIENKEHVKDLIAASVKFTSIIVIPFLILFSFLSENLIKIFYTEAYLAASEIFPLILTGSLVYGLAGILSITLYSIYKPKIRLFVLVLGAVINIILSFILIPTFGLYGASIAFLLSQLFVLMCFLYFVNKNLPLRFSKNNFYFIPTILIFILILYFSLQISNLFLQGAAIILDILIYIYLVTNFRILHKNDLFILELFPNKFGFGLLKKVARKLIR